MKVSTKILSKLAVAFSSHFPQAYERLTLKNVRKHQDLPGTMLKKPLHECKVALLSTAGVHLRSDVPFDVDNRAGDHSIRMIPSDAAEEDLTVTHIFYDTTFAKTDPSIVFPLKQLKELAKEGVIGSVSDTSIGLNGAILDTTLVERESVPNAVQALQNENVDCALLVPG